MQVKPMQVNESHLDKHASFVKQVTFAEIEAMQDEYRDLRRSVDSLSTISRKPKDGLFSLFNGERDESTVGSSYMPVDHDGASAGNFFFTLERPQSVESPCGITCSHLASLYDPTCELFVDSFLVRNVSEDELDEKVSGADYPFEVLGNPYDSEVNLLRAAWGFIQDNFDLVSWAVCARGWRNTTEFARLTLTVFGTSLLPKTKIIIAPIDRGSILALEHTGVIWFARGYNRWEHYVRMWRSGDHNTRLCAALDLSATLMHELLHLSGFLFADLEENQFGTGFLGRILNRITGASDDCDTTYAIENPYRWALFHRYPQGTEPGCCDGLDRGRVYDCGNGLFPSPSGCTLGDLPSGWNPGIGAWLAERWNNLKNWAADKWDAIKKWAADKWDDVEKWAADKWDDVKNAWQDFKEGAAKVYEKAEDIYCGIFPCDQAIGEGEDNKRGYRSAGGGREICKVCPELCVGVGRGTPIWGVTDQEIGDSDQALDCVIKMMEAKIGDLKSGGGWMSPSGEEYPDPDSIPGEF